MFAAVLSKNAQDALALLGKSKILPDKTYLAGGSALALHFGHRISEDFDFFTRSHFKGKVIAQKLKTIGRFKIQESKEKDNLLGLFNKTKFSLFFYDYPLIFKPILFQNIWLASPRDIMAMKLAAIMDRGTKKDFVDLYFLSKKGITIDEGFKYYQRKYKALSNNLYSLIKGISYFDDADNSEMPEMIKKVDWEEVKKFFRQEVVRLAKKHIG